MKLNIDITFPLRPSGWASGSTIFKNIGRNGICSTLHEVGLYLVLSQDVEGISSQIFVPGVRWGRVVGGLWLWWVVCGGSGERDQLVPCRPRSARRPLPHPSKREESNEVGVLHPTENPPLGQINRNLQWFSAAGRKETFENPCFSKYCSNGGCNLSRRPFSKRVRHVRAHGGGNRKSTLNRNGA